MNSCQFLIGFSLLMYRCRIEEARLSCSTLWSTQNSHITMPQTIPASTWKPYFLSVEGSCPSPSTLSGRYFLQNSSTPAITILLKRQSVIWQLMGVFLPKTSPPTIKPATKLLRGRVPTSLARRRQAALQKKTKVPSFLLCSQALRKMALMVLALNVLNKKVITSECTKRTLLPYSRPFRSPFSTPKASSPLMFIEQLQMIRLLTNLGRGCLYRFAPNDKTPKNLSKFLKMKKNEQPVETNEEAEAEKEAPHYAHRILYLQYAPLVILALPTIYFFQDVTDPMFLQSVNLLQYYTSGLLCFNSFFTQEKVKHFYPFLMGVAVANSLTGPLSVATPILIGALNLYAPFTDQKYHKFETAEDESKIKTYMNVQALYYFVVMVILTLKAFHFLELHLLEKKLNDLEKKNKELNQQLQVQP